MVPAMTSRQKGNQHSSPITAKYLDQFHQLRLRTVSLQRAFTCFILFQTWLLWDITQLM
jgi:hypothetical protein